MSSLSTKNKQKKFLVSAPGKVILFGEHAVVYGKTAIAGSVSLRSYLLLESREDNVVELYVPDLGSTSDKSLTWKTSMLPYELLKQQDCDKELFNQLVYEKVKSLAITKINEYAITQKASLTPVQIQQQEIAATAFLYLYTMLIAAQSLHLQEQHGLRINVRSLIPVGAGLGSSASYSVCLATGLLLLLGYIKVDHADDNSENIDTLLSSSFPSHARELINRWAFQAEKVIHGTPSGIDNTVATFGGAVQFTKGVMENLKGFQSIRFLLINTKVPRDTRTQVANVRLKRDKYPHIVNPILDAIEGVSMSLKDILKSIDVKSSSLFEDLEELIDLNHYLITSLGVGHLALDKVRDISAKYGLHSKLTGAGGGGCAIILLRDDVPQNVIDLVKNDLTAIGFECFETSVGGPGVGGIDVANMNINFEQFSRIDKNQLQEMTTEWRHFGQT
ncbi:hypothetical protein G9A89_015409 [Geosiphon pyriformis]|nr:hypothetical protein G9A89_015409 [Geosiphon pyriformis]